MVKIIKKYALFGACVLRGRFTETGRFYALKCKPTENKSHIYWDSDIAKWLEAAAYVLLTPNVCRFIADLPEYIWYSERDTLILSQYISSSFSLDGLEASLVSDFPKSGRIKLKINSYGKKIFLKLRKPEWCDEKFDNEENGFIVYDRIFNGKEMVLDFLLKRIRSIHLIRQGKKTSNLNLSPTAIGPIGKYPI